VVSRGGRSSLLISGNDGEGRGKPNSGFDKGAPFKAYEHEKDRTQNFQLVKENSRDVLQKEKGG